MANRPSNPPNRSNQDKVIFDLLTRIDQLEAIREQLDELGITTRAELEERIATLETEAAELEDGR